MEERNTQEEQPAEEKEERVRCVTETHVLTQGEGTQRKADISVWVCAEANKSERRSL